MENNREDEFERMGRKNPSIENLRSGLENPNIIKDDALNTKEERLTGIRNQIIEQRSEDEKKDKPINGYNHQEARGITPEEKGELKELLDMVKQGKFSEAIKEAKQSNNSYFIDKVHDSINNNKRKNE